MKIFDICKCLFEKMCILQFQSCLWQNLVFRFHLSVFRFTKERLNTSIDTSKKNDTIKKLTLPLIQRWQGEKILFMANFPPRKMMGIESQGMILSAVDADGKLVVTTVTSPVKNGSQVG